MRQRSMKSESDVLKRFAQEIAGKLSARCISQLTQSTDVMSGEDSYLKNTWEEICIQIQRERSYFWDAYDHMVRTTIEFYLTELNEHEKCALWLQTEPYLDWFERVEKGYAPKEDYPVFDEDIVDYIVNDYVYRTAIDYTNDNIDNFVESLY